MFFNKYIEYVSLTSLRYREWDQLISNGFSTIFLAKCVGFEPFCKVGPVHFKNSGYVMIVLMKKCIIINCSKTI